MTAVGQPRKQPRGWHLSPFAVWSATCPLVRYLDAIASDEEDVMDASLALALRGVSP